MMYHAQQGEGYDSLVRYPVRPLEGKRFGQCLYTKINLKGEDSEGHNGIVTR
jgi:hypothetical protein